jgi:preprotein translocase subunit YajC
MKGGMSGRTMYLIMLLILVILILALFYFAGNRIIEKLFLKGLK